MRDLLILIVVLASIAATLRYPFAGVITWAWFTLMTPNQLGFGVFGLPLNLLIAAATMGSMVINGELRKLRVDGVSIALLLFAVWLTVSQAFSLAGDVSATYYDRFIKTLVFAMIAVQLTSSRLRMHALLWMLVISIGYFGFKGGLFTLATLGQHRVQGLDDTVLADNNHLGIAMATILPLILYLRERSARAPVRHALAALFVLTLIAILGTHSRGAFISIIVFGGFFWLYSRHKVAILAGLMALMVPAIAFMPSKWTERMSTISSAGEDESFMGRITVWKVNWKFAEQNPMTGAGLRVPYEDDIVQQVAPELVDKRIAAAAHSIYFEILGGTGFVGLFLFLTVIVSALLTAMATSRKGRGGKPEDATWNARFAHYAQVSLATFCIGGASVSMEMWDGYWMIIALIAAAARIPSDAPTPTAAVSEDQRTWRASARGRQRLRSKAA
ncbi:MAG: putative O-glycosylation ligase, exosortase A system-associated [Pseudomonadota bacterium]